MTGAGLPASEILYAWYAIESPPRSPMFSPSVSSPLIVHAGQRAEAVELFDQQLRALLELRLVFGLPPVAQLAVAVEAAALVVEAVPDLVADHRANRAVVHRIVGRDDRRTAAAGSRPGTRSRS